MAGVLLTDAEIDHTARLLLLRESSTPLRIYGSEQVRRALTDGYPVLPILAEYSGVDWRSLSPGAAVAIDGSSLEVASFPAGGDAPRYLAGTGAEVEATGLVFRDRSSGGVVPGLARLDDDVLGRLAASDVVLVDGTFWRDDELRRLGISERTAGQMGHVPLSGGHGSLQALARLERRCDLPGCAASANPSLSLPAGSPVRSSRRGAEGEIGWVGTSTAISARSRSSIRPAAAPAAGCRARGRPCSCSLRASRRATASRWR